MTSGQQRALRELERLHVADPGFRFQQPRVLASGWVVVEIALRIGLLEFRDGGLPLREREHFLLYIPPDFPFEYPSLVVNDTRFAGFPHVTWSKWLCLYQSKMEWNPSDGLFGFFDRLSVWLARAARNDMDPVEGPLEPPHYVTNFSELPVIVRSDAPAKAGELWIGWARLQPHPNRVDLVGWAELEHQPTDCSVALAVMLPRQLPMEFPAKGADLFQEFFKQGIDRNLLLRLLSLACRTTPDGSRVYVVMGFPMRRAADGSARLHIAAWVTGPELAQSIRSTLVQPDDYEEVQTLRKQLADSIYALLELTTINWCQVLDDRNEIVVHRDADTPIAWFRDKHILIAGCGALGSWSAEFLARAKPRAIDVVDNSIVKPGLLVRQNFTLDDIASNKAEALTRRLQTLSAEIQVTGFAAEAHSFMTRDLSRLETYDYVLDCTASSIFQMKVERDWETLRPHVRRFSSFVIDARAQRAIGINLGRDSVDGPWTAYLRLKYALCCDDRRRDLIDAFYGPNAATPLFQPEPGCSDPTFSGSTADTAPLVGVALNTIARTLPEAGRATAFGFSLPDAGGPTGTVERVNLLELREVCAGSYRVLLSHQMLNQARAAVRHNSRTRSLHHETGGLIWGYWDDASQIILAFDASGPPPDSRHDPGHFICGVEGTNAEAAYRAKRTFGVTSFLGFWHTHPNLPPQQSAEDIHGMSTLIARVGQNQRRALMVIFGRDRDQGAAGVYIYETLTTTQDQQLIHVGASQLRIGPPVA